MTLPNVIQLGPFSGRPAAGSEGHLYFASDTGRQYRDNGISWDDVTPPAAPATSHYVTTQAEAALPASVNLGALATGLVKITVAAGVATPSIAAAGTDYATPYAAQAAAEVLAGPATGPNAAPAFRALVASDLPVMTGDSGAGGVKGAVPAPGAGAAAAGEYLKADGAWSVPPAVFAAQNAAKVLAGPTSGAAAVPTFRALAPTDLPAMTGDSGAGGAQGAVPAPAAGTAAQGKYLKADGTWSVPPGTTPAMTGDSGAGGTGGTVPAPTAAAAAAGKYLKADGTWSVPPGSGSTPVMIGDTGTGGVAGSVPAPGAGTAAAGKFLKADGTWAVPTGGGGSTINFADAETPAGAIGGGNVNFTLAHTPNPSASLQLFKNGVLQIQSVDYSLTVAAIAFVTAPDANDTLVAFYRY